MTSPVETIPESDAQSRDDLIVAASAEYRVWKQWKTAGLMDVEPATPNLDQLRSFNQNGTVMTATSTRTPKIAHRFYRNGKALGDTYNTMAHLALQSTKGISDAGKLNSKGLVALLADAGIAEPKSTTWSIDLPNGNTIGNVVEGDAIPEALTVVKGRTRHPKTPTVTYDLVRSGARDWFITADGVKVGKTHRSRKAAADAFEAMTA